jgi:hypothetical protein
MERRSVLVLAVVAIFCVGTPQAKATGTLYYDDGGAQSNVEQTEF